MGRFICSLREGELWLQETGLAGILFLEHLPTELQLNRLTAWAGLLTGGAAERASVRIPVGLTHVEQFSLSLG